ncbi:hypothetical protein WSM22_36650 [Cytophagales bacterium WSM2-2]|nr:hypothetical protein WSM22_36650 [Cytophagales bacterium WSM2-2]
MQFSASASLRPYVKGYTVITVDQDIINEVFYPSGYVDFAVNISGGSAITIINGRSIDMPNVEVLGHLTMPTRLTVARGMSVLIARIYPYATQLFFPNPVSDFTNNSIDLSDIRKDDSNQFYEQLMQGRTIEEKVMALDDFLLDRLKQNEKLLTKANFLAQMCNRICAEGDAFDIRRLAENYGFSERYIQKLFNNVVGLSPREFFTVQRFNKSLELIRTSQAQLTSIAYDCGYYDQAHFIKEFRKFTGITPSEARPSLSVG